MVPVMMLVAYRYHHLRISLRRRINTGKHE
jgi:hypothetical protein